MIGFGSSLEKMKINVALRCGLLSSVPVLSLRSTIWIDRFWTQRLPPVFVGSQMLPRSGFNPWSLVCGQATVRGVDSWNSGGLLAFDRKARDRKFRYLDQLGGSILCLQEVHGSMCDLQSELVHRAWRGAVFGSFLPEGQIGGGVVTYIPERIKGATVCCEDFVPGRAHRVQIRRSTVHGEIKVSIWNVHNYGIDPEAIERTCVAMSADLVEAKASPETCLVA